MLLPIAAHVIADLAFIRRDPINNRQLPIGNVTGRSRTVPSAAPFAVLGTLSVLATLRLCDY